MKFKELKALQTAELGDKLTELKKELMKENAQVAIGTMPKNPRKLRLAKKTIARIEMILAQKNMLKPAAEKPAEAKKA
jgi:ribosomal protein L29